MKSFVAHRENNSTQSGKIPGSRSTVASVIAGIAFAAFTSIHPSAEGRDSYNPSSIATSPTYSATEGNAYHYWLYGDEEKKDVIRKLGLFPSDTLQSAYVDYKEIIYTNNGFQDFCMKWQNISKKYGLDPDKQSKLFLGMYNAKILPLEKIGIPEDLGSLQNKAAVQLSDISGGENPEDCKKIDFELRNFLWSTQEFRNKEKQLSKEQGEILMWIIIASVVGPLGFIGFLGWAYLRESKK